MTETLQHVQRCARGLDLPPTALQPLANFAELLARHGRRANLVGTTDVRRIVDEIVVDSTRLSALIAGDTGEMIDIGSGAGIPIIPLLLVLPGWTGVAVEPRLKRREFTIAARRTLGLTDRMEIVDGRLSEHGDLVGEIDPDRRFDLAVTKAVFAPTDWARLARGLVRSTGQIGVFASRDVGLPPSSQAVEYTTESGSDRIVGVL